MTLLLALGAAWTFCSAPAADYYSFDLVTTKNLPGSGYASGTVEVAFAPSPFGVSLAGDGSYSYDLRVRVERVKPPRMEVVDSAGKTVYAAKLEYG